MNEWEGIQTHEEEDGAKKKGKKEGGHEKEREKGRLKDGGEEKEIGDLDYCPVSPHRIDSQSQSLKPFDQPN